MTHTRLIYVSRPVDHSAAVLDDILATSRRCNAQADITGALITRADIYLQMIEGPLSAVDQTYRRIAADPRHDTLRLLVRRPTDWRLFPGWTMRSASAKDWMWTPQQVSDGLPAQTPRPQVEAIFVRLWREGMTRSVPGITLGRKRRR